MCVREALFAKVARFHSFFCLFLLKKEPLRRWMYRLVVGCFVKGPLPIWKVGVFDLVQGQSRQLNMSGIYAEAMISCQELIKCCIVFRLLFVCFLGRWGERGLVMSVWSDRVGSNALR